MYWLLGSSAVVALLCWKSLPFAYHLRLFHVLAVPHLRKKVYDPDKDGALLFDPVVRRHTCSLSDIDANMHKSNTTYFIDLDFVRVEAMGVRFFGGLKRLNEEGPKDSSGNPVRVGMMLGGTQCSFRREIPPFASYETWTKILCWDEKWFYLVTHFVRPSKATGQASTIESKEDDRQDVFATAITKYVIKAGRATVPPERLIEASGFMHPSSATSTNQTGWGPTRIEAERQKGLKYAQAFISLDHLHATFSRL